jgi:hypothetical protein
MISPPCADAIGSDTHSSRGQLRIGRGAEGEAFLITSSYGTAQLPDEAEQPIAALALTDHRLGAITNRPPGARRQHPRDRDRQAAPAAPTLKTGRPSSVEAKQP